MLFEAFSFVRLIISRVFYLCHNWRLWYFVLFITILPVLRGHKVTQGISDCRYNLKHNFSIKISQKHLKLHAETITRQPEIIHYANNNTRASKAMGRSSLNGL